MQNAVRIAIPLVFAFLLSVFCRYTASGCSMQHLRPRDIFGIAKFDMISALLAPQGISSAKCMSKAKLISTCPKGLISIGAVANSRFTTAP